MPGDEGKGYAEECAAHFQVAASAGPAGESDDERLKNFLCK